MLTKKQAIKAIKANKLAALHSGLIYGPQYIGCPLELADYIIKFCDNALLAAYMSNYQVANNLAVLTNILQHIAYITSEKDIINTSKGVFNYKKIVNQLDALFKDVMNLNPSNSNYTVNCQILFSKIHTLDNISVNMMLKCSSRCSDVNENLSQLAEVFSAVIGYGYDDNWAKLSEISLQSNFRDIDFIEFQKFYEEYTHDPNGKEPVRDFLYEHFPKEEVNRLFQSTLNY